MQRNVKNKNEKLEKITVEYSSGNLLIIETTSFLLEERCEPSFPLFRNTGTRRFCPDIQLWKELDNYEIGDGYGVRNPLNDDYNAGYQNNDRNQYNTHDRNKKYHPPPTVISVSDDTETGNNY